MSAPLPFLSPSPRPCHSPRLLPSGFVWRDTCRRRWICSENRAFISLKLMHNRWADPCGVKCVWGGLRNVTAVAINLCFLRKDLVSPRAREPTATWFLWGRFKVRPDDRTFFFLMCEELFSSSWRRLACRANTAQSRIWLMHTLFKSTTGRCAFFTSEKERNSGCCAVLSAPAVTSAPCHGNAHLKMDDHKRRPDVQIDNARPAV